MGPMRKPRPAPPEPEWHRFNIRDVRFLLIVAGGVCIYFCAHMLANFGEDTTRVSNGAFLLTSTLAALCFGHSRAVDPKDPDRAKIVRAGERCFQGSAMLVLASLTKYALMSVHQLEYLKTLPGAVQACNYTLGLVTACCFFYAVFVGYIGFSDIVTLLFERGSRPLDAPTRPHP